VLLQYCSTNIENFTNLFQVAASNENGAGLGSREKLSEYELNQGIHNYARDVEGLETTMVN
jgi:hypothetical protein